MTQEEKAKAYDEVVEKLSKLYRDYDSVSNLIDVKEELENILSELKESEGERIRKAIIEIVKKDEERIGVNAHLKKIQWLDEQGEHAKFRDSIQVGDKVTRNRDGVLVNLSQLERVAKKDEKQCEQKSADKVEPKFHEGDMIIHKELGGDYIHNPHKIIQVDILDKKYRLEGGLVAHFCEQDDYELVEQKPAETEKGAKGNDREIPNSSWSEEDEARFESCIEVLQTSDGYDTINAKWLKNIKERVSREVNCTATKEWSEEDEKFVHGLIRGLSAKRDIHGHTTFSSDGIDITKTIDWLKSIKDRVQPLQQEWSEKDERMFKNTIALIETLEDYNKAPNGFGDVKFWLKSLKERYTWKPSDEQIIALRWILNNVPYCKHKEEISGLLDQIKEL